VTLLRGAWITPRSTIGERAQPACFKCMNGSRAVTVAICRASQPPSGRDLPLLALEVLVYKEHRVVFRGQEGMPCAHP
jgi:hypothetical protein